MSKNLVIVESPAKCKTINKYLGKDFTVLASYGHVRDLPAKENSIDTENDFKMTYQLIDRNKKHVDAIKKAAKSCETIYLATDPDREGEAISWHVHQALKNARLLKDKNVYRIAFNEITKTAVSEAIANPRELSMDLVNSQQARRCLDFLVGFKLSPLLWKKVRRGLSAGRVQSPALRMIVERENEIQSFVKQEYWSITGNLKANKKVFPAKLTHYNEKKLEQFDINSEDLATSAIEVINQDANGTLIVSNVEKKQKKRNPQPPFITSTIQQEASRKLGFSTKKTMMVAQQLYEGVDLGSGEAMGLITYMRTDSIHLSEDAIRDIRNHINKVYGEENLPGSPRVFKSKSKNAQEAHEAIRPTLVDNTPDSVKSFLTADQFKLYQLVWKRAVASQMIHAVINTLSIEFETQNQKHIFKATGSNIHKPGFITLYQESTDDDKPTETEDEINIPLLEKGAKVNLLEIIPKQHFTEPPPRYSEATLVKSLEEHGIGRPSTYSSIISTLMQREYVELVSKRFHPTDVGNVVNKFLTEYFTKYVDYDYTAKLEDKLDSIANGNVDWLPVMHQFWKPFIKLVEEIDGSVKRSDVTQEKIDEKCPDCGNELSIRLGRRGKFIGCTNYPECKYTRPVEGDNQEKEKVEPEIIPDRKCPSCESDLVIKMGRYGKFVGCSNYPECKHMEPLEKPKDTGVECPQCKKANIMEKKSRRGKIFYSCNQYPKCKYSLWYKPIAESCPKCNWPILMHKSTKKFGEQKVCPQEECDFVENISEAAGE